MSEFSRRGFMQGAAMGAAAGAALLGTSKTGWAQANEKVRMAVIGIRGRGQEHIEQWAAIPNVEVATLCDIDENNFEGIINKFFKEKNLAVPKVETDLRKVMEDPDIDAVSIATPNHWHTLAAIWAIQAGKDVYVEKPCSHNVWEGRQLVKAAQKYGRIVQHGTQIRSNPSMKDAMKKLAEGVIGEVYMARGLCYKTRDTIGHKPVEPVPAGVNYDMWLGPAPVHEYTANRLHYNWHYMWDYGNGDMGNQGVHQMDVARWGLGVGLPSKVSTMGGMFLFDDDKEVPNTTSAGFFYPDAGKKGRMLVFDTRPWLTNDEGSFFVNDANSDDGFTVTFNKGAKVGNVFYGSDGIMVIDSYERYRTYLGPKYEPGPSGEEEGNHFENFIDAVRSRKPESLNAPIEEGHLSAALCHLGLISIRVGRSFDFDPETETILNDEEASKLLTRPYREPYVVPGEV